MNIRKHIEQEIREAEKENESDNWQRGYLTALEKVLKWMDEAKVTRKPRFVKPTLDEINAAFKSKGLSVAEANRETVAFWNHYESCGWVIGGNGKKMVSWKASVAGWVNRNKKSSQNFKTMDNDQLYAEATRLGIRTAGKSTFDLRAALEAAV